MSNEKRALRHGYDINYALNNIINSGTQKNIRFVNRFVSCESVLLHNSTGSPGLRLLLLQSAPYAKENLV